MSEFVRCVGCGEIVEAQEPCSCVFDVVGTIDSKGVLHTAARVPVLPADARCPMCWGDPGDCVCDEADTFDPYEGISESEMLFAMNLVEQLGYDIEDARAIARGDR